MSKSPPEAPQKKSPVFRHVGENLYRLQATGGYYALFKKAGKQIRRTLRTDDHTLAIRRLADLKRKIRQFNNAQGNGHFTFKAYSQRWLAAVATNLKAKTVTRMGNCVTGLLPFLGSQPVRSINYGHCEEWSIKRGRGVSSSTYRQERRVLIAILNATIRDGIILDNPATHLPTRKLAKAKIIIPTREQFCELVRTMRLADIRGVHGVNLVELLACSGMRLAEATHLRWEEIEFDQGCFIVTGGEYGTKNHEPRTLPLFPAMRQLLERIRAEGLTPTRGPVTPIKGARTLMANAARKADLPRFTHHSMRHYFCSNAIEAGIDFKVIAGWLGHKDGGVLVAKTYGHLRDTHSFEMAKRMNFGADDAKPENVLPLGVKSA